MSAASFPWNSHLRLYYEQGVNILLNALFPLRCGGCGDLSTGVFCERCTPQMRPLCAPMCALCGKPFDPLAFTASICTTCRAHRPPIEVARAAFVFEGPVREAVHRLKYQRHHSYAKRLSPLLQYKWELDETLRDFDPDFLAAVPLHPTRQRQRGFNQSHLLAHELAQIRSIHLFNGLRRVRKTPSQVGLDHENRRDNVRHAFEVALAYQTEVVGKRFLLIDDVFTTGATLGECARVLKKAGAIEVCALTLARQSTPQEPIVPQRDWRTLTRW